MDDLEAAVQRLERELSQAKADLAAAVADVKTSVLGELQGAETRRDAKVADLNALIAGIQAQATKKLGCALIGMTVVLIAAMYVIR